MSAFISYAPGHYPPPGCHLRFGQESVGVGASVQWLLKRNCSLAPRQLLTFYASLCLLSLAIAGVFWIRGALLVMPFAGAELLAVGAALLVYARHAADREIIRLRTGRLVVRRFYGPRVEQIEFEPAWVRVEPESGDRSLIELSGQGRRISVGRFVRPELRRQLADELRWALRRWQSRERSALAAENGTEPKEN
ncbi:MAG: DUF2244 domain-containing protein [Pseudomonadota bacterium]|nr:DUF2244 domain-containing protein [Pseudomonadota bacterium]